MTPFGRHSNPCGRIIGGGENIDDMIAVLHKLEKKYSHRIETNLWLGKCYYLKGLNNLNSRKKYNQIAEDYAVKAYRIDKNSFPAFFVLLNALSSCDDFDYVLSNYGEWIRAMAPLPTGELLPDMPPCEKWNEAKRNWQLKDNFDHLSAAIRQFEAIAESRPKDALAQLWAGYAYYHLGDYYMQIGLHKEKGVAYYDKALSYCDKALAIAPYNQEAHFWYQLSLSRKIQVASLFKKAAHLKSLMNHLIFCVQENALYNSAGPVYVLATMVVEGGWVCEKGMAMAGYTVDMVITFLQIAEILYPEDRYIPYITGVLLERQKRDKEAIAVLERSLQKGPPAPDDPNRRDNSYNYDITRELYKKLLDRNG